LCRKSTIPWVGRRKIFGLRLVENIKHFTRHATRGSGQEITATLLAPIPVGTFDHGRERLPPVLLSPNQPQISLLVYRKSFG
jgi:hypothetical protein